jgi:hypothetical protein
MRRPFTTTARRRVALGPAAVHALITSPATWPEWQSEIDAASGPDRLSTGDSVDGDARMLGFAVAGHADMSEVEARRVVHEVIVGVRMRVRYDLEPDGSGAIVRHTLTADLPAGIAGRLLSVFLRRRLRRMQRTLLDNLAGRASAGEVRDG